MVDGLRKLWEILHSGIQQTRHENTFLSHYSRRSATFASTIYLSKNSWRNCSLQQNGFQAWQYIPQVFIVCLSALIRHCFCTTEIICSELNCGLYVSIVNYSKYHRMPKIAQLVNRWTVQASALGWGGRESKAAKKFLACLGDILCILSHTYRSTA